MAGDNVDRTKSVEGVARYAFGLLLLAAVGLRAQSIVAGGWRLGLSSGSPWQRALFLVSIGVEWTMATWLLTGFAWTGCVTLQAALE
jgi:hypothetical protein